MEAVRGVVVGGRGECPPDRCHFRSVPENPTREAGAKWDEEGGGECKRNDQTSGELVGIIGVERRIEMGREERGTVSSGKMAAALAEY